MHKNKAVRDKVRGKDTFSVTVKPDVDYAFVVTMRPVLDEINYTPNSGGGEGGDGDGGGGGCGGDGGGGGCGGGGGI
ncbi:hypothetical protein MKX01_029876 [Papaver californicum]|nr:hypothetical protein MKX01_029876 [Papaver californicum]